MISKYGWIPAMLIAGAVGQAQAVSLDTTGNWNVATNWNPDAVPSGVDVTVTSGLAVTLDSAVPNVTYVTLGPSTGAGTWNINSGADLTVTSQSSGRSLVIGSSRTSNVTQTGGTVNATAGGMYLAYTGTGFVGTTTWDISGGTLNVGLDDVDGAYTNLGIVIGRQGDASMSITGTANVSTTGEIFMGEIGLSTATQTTSLTIADSAVLNIGYGIETGKHSTNTINTTININGGTINSGTASTGGLWRLSNGDGATTNVYHTAGTVNIGTNDVGDLVGDSLLLGYGLGQANYVFSGGNLTVDDFMDIGRTGGGAFTISGSAVGTFGHFRTGSQGTAVGITNINGGTINAEFSLQVGVTSGATGTVTQTAGAVTVGAEGVLISGLSTAGTATYNISGGSLNATGALALGLGVSGVLNITDNAAQVSFGGYEFGVNGQLSAASGTTIKITSNTGAATIAGNILGMTDAGATSSNLAGLGNVTLVFNGGAVANPADIGGVEVAGVDMGAVFEGLVDNFALAGLEVGDLSDVGAIKLIDLADNAVGAEALYVQSLTVTAGSVIDLNGLNLYYVTGSIDPSATFLNGTATQILVPEPAAIATAMLGLGLVASRRRRVK